MRMCVVNIMEIGRLTFGMCHPFGHWQAVGMAFVKQATRTLRDGICQTGNNHMEVAAL